MDRMEQMLAFARNCAKEAGKIQLSYFRGNHLHIETKFNMHDVVTVADKESERYIIGEIKRTTPKTVSPLHWRPIETVNIGRP